MRSERAGPWRGFAAPERRWAVVRRVLATAAELERHARGAGAIRARRLVVEAAGGCLDMGGRDRILLGRGAGCDLVIPDGGVSRAHAAVTWRGGEYWVEDLGSQNGTWHRGERVARRCLADGEELHLSGAPVRFHIW